MSLRNVFIVVIAGILWSCVLGLQRPPPRYSQQFMPETSFTCRNKIVGSYYADPETDCQLFHVCVSVAGLIQDYKFLCPNDTAFDQESQTCANWYDVGCEAATLYYASDNFDLYRIGSGLESLHYDSSRSSDAEPQDHLQRSETSDPVRSAANNYNRVASNSYNNPSATSNNNNNNHKSDILRGSSSSNFYNSRNNGKEDEYETEKTYREDVEPKKKIGVRKVARKQQFYSNNNNINNGNGYVSSTAAPSSTTSQSYDSNYNNNNNNNRYYNNNNNYNNHRNNYNDATTTSRPTQDYNKQPNVKLNVQASTYKPPTVQQSYTTYQVPSTTSKPTTFNYNNNNNNQKSNNFGANPPTTVKPITYSQNVQHSPSTGRPTSYNNNYQENYNNQNTRSTTLAPSSTNYQPQQADYTNFQRSYNNIQRSTSAPSTTFPSTTVSAFVDNYRNNNNNNNDNQFSSKNGGLTSSRQSQSQTTKYYQNYSANNYAPTTYAPLAAKKSSNDNGNDGGQYFDGSNQQSVKSTQYYDSTKAPKKAAQYSNSNNNNNNNNNNNYEVGNTGKYYESSTSNYDFVRSQAIGFSPSSINLLAETPKTTTPAPRRTAAPTTYNPNNFNNRGAQQYSTTPRGTTYNVSGSARPFSSTTTASFADATTPKPKSSSKKNDYDYAYYDNVGALEYDGLDLENVARNKESTKISRN